MNKWGITIMVLAVVLLLGWGGWVLHRNGLPEASIEGEKTMETSALLPVQARLVPLEDGESGQPVEFADIIELEPVGEGETEGLAMRIFDGFKFIHSIEGVFPELREGERYQGWLINNENEEEFIATGSFERQENEWNLWYASEEVPVDFDRVVVSVETDDSESMVERVLEGQF